MFGSAVGWIPETSNPGKRGSDAASVNIAGETDFFKKIIQIRRRPSVQWSVASVSSRSRLTLVTQDDCEIPTHSWRRGKDFRDSNAHDAGTMGFPLGPPCKSRDQANGFRHLPQKLPNPLPPSDAYTRPLIAVPQPGADQGNHNPDTQHSEKGFGDRGDDDDADTQGGKAHQFEASNCSRGRTSYPSHVADSFPKHPSEDKARAGALDAPPESSGPGARSQSTCAQLLDSCS